MTSPPVLKKSPFSTAALHRGDKEWATENALHVPVRRRNSNVHRLPQRCGESKARRSESCAEHRLECKEDLTAPHGTADSICLRPSALSRLSEALRLHRRSQREIDSMNSKPSKSGFLADRCTDVKLRRDQLHNIKLVQGEVLGRHSVVSACRTLYYVLSFLRLGDSALIKKQR